MVKIKKNDLYNFVKNNKFFKSDYKKVYNIIKTVLMKNGVEEKNIDLTLRIKLKHPNNKLFNQKEIKHNNDLGYELVYVEYKDGTKRLEFKNVKEYLIENVPVSNIVKREVLLNMEETFDKVIVPYMLSQNKMNITNTIYELIDTTLINVNTLSELMKEHIKNNQVLIIKNKALVSNFIYFMKYKGEDIVLQDYNNGNYSLKTLKRVIKDNNIKQNDLQFEKVSYNNKKINLFEPKKIRLILDFLASIGTSLDKSLLFSSERDTILTGQYNFIDSYYASIILLSYNLSIDSDYLTDTKRTKYLLYKNEHIELLASFEYKNIMFFENNTEAYGLKPVPKDLMEAESKYTESISEAKERFKVLDTVLDYCKGNGTFETVNINDLISLLENQISVVEFKDKYKKD